MAYRINSLALSCLGAALLGIGAAPVRADTRAGAVLSHFGYSVVDLTPDDGVAGGVDFLSERFATNTRASTIQRVPGPGGGPPPDFQWTHVYDDWNGAGQFFATDSRSARQGSTQASVALSGDVHAAGFGAVLEARATRARRDGLYAHDAWASAQPAWPSYGPLDDRFMVVLAPHTALVWSGQLRLDVEKARRSAEARHERAFTGASLRIWDRYGEELAAWGAGLDTKDRAPGLVSQAVDLHLTWANATGDVAQGQVLFSLAASAGSSVGAVPEPGPVALMLAGMGVVGVVARRRGTPRGRAEVAA